MKLLKLTSIILSVCIFCSCNQADKASGKTNGNLIEITPFIETSIILYDTTSIKTVAKDAGDGNMHDYDAFHGKEFFLNDVQFNEFLKIVTAMIHDPNAKLYVMGKLTKPGELSKKLVIKGDSVDQEQFDKEGNSFIVRVAGSTDSTKAIEQVRQIDFYESWALDPKNNMISRNVLGYCVIYNDTDKGFNRELFSVFKDEEAFTKFKKYKKW